MSKLNNDERFQYVSYQHTDLRKTFARARRQQRHLKPAAPDAIVITMERRKVK